MAVASSSCYDGHRGNEFNSSSRESLHAKISRDESFVSQAMYV